MGGWGKKGSAWVFVMDGVRPSIIILDNEGRKKNLTKMVCVWNQSPPHAWGCLLSNSGRRPLLIGLKMVGIYIFIFILIKFQVNPADWSDLKAHTAQHYSPIIIGVIRSPSIKSSLCLLWYWARNTLIFSFHFFRSTSNCILPPSPLGPLSKIIRIIIAKWLFIACASSLSLSLQ